MRSFGRIPASLPRVSARLRLAIGAVMFGALALAPAGVAAQTQTPEPPPVDIITPHITDSYEIEVPWFNAEFAKAFCVGGRHAANGECLPMWDPVHIGGSEINLSPTKHVIFMLVAAVIVLVVLISTARAQARQQAKAGHPQGFAGGIEAAVLYLRNEVILPNVGPHGDAFVPFGLTLFFFILTANLLGLIPYGATATGNIAVTAMLAIITFIVIEVAGMRTHGFGYLGSIFYWNKDLPIFVRIPMFFIMTPVELIGKFAKPFALAIRLFANMTAGHIVVLALIGLIFAFKSLASGAPFLLAVGVMMLELFVALLQAYIFTLLSSVFIGLSRESGH